MKIEIDRKIVDKWIPVIDRYFSYKNGFINELICLYCEWYSLTDYDRNLNGKLGIIRKNIFDFSRKKIVSKVFNQASGLIEYELENGEFIPTDINQIGSYLELEMDDLIKIFGIEFIRGVDIKEFRNYQISKIV